MDHAGQLGSAGRVRHERRLDRVDARPHRQRLLDLGLSQDPDRSHRRRSLAPRRPPGQHGLSAERRPRYGRSMARIRPFEMERYQSLYWHLVDHDLSESGVTPLTIRELLGPEADAATFLQQALGYPLSEGSYEARAAIAQWYPDCGPENVTIVNGGSEANLLSLWSLLDRDDRLAFMLPNYCQGRGLGRSFGKGVDTFKLKLRDGRWALDLEQLERAVGKRTKAVMLCNPNNPTGAVLTEGEMEAVIEVAARAGAWIVADEIYRGAEIDTDITSPTFWGRYDKVVVTSGLSKAFAMPGLRIGWAVGPPEAIAKI